MQIGITEGLRKFLGYSKPSASEESDLFYCWDANRVKLNGRIMLVLCNSSNRFCCVSAMRAADWRYFETTCKRLIRESMLLAGFSGEAIDAYFVRAGVLQLTRTHGPKPLGGLNTTINDLHYHECERGVQFQAAMTQWANNMIGRCATRNDYVVPRDCMEEDLVAHGINPRGLNPTTSPSNLRIAYDANEESLDDPASITSSHDEEVIDGLRTSQRPTQYISESIGEPAEDPNRCIVCGRDARVFLGGTPYCLNCYNRMTENILNLPHAKHDNSVFVAFDKSGNAVQFAVERMLMPELARWTAQEMVEQGAPHLSHNREGVCVVIYADPEEDEEVTLARLEEKAQEVLSKPSTKQIVGLAAGTYAEEQGWAQICCDPGGDQYFLIDGQRYSGDEFLYLLRSFEGFNLRWNIGDAGDPLFV